jgi:hypothetical protein
MRKLKLEIHQLDKAETRRGWVRIEEATRGNIKSGSLIVLSKGDRKSRRIILGAPRGYINISDTGGMIFLDEVTREELGFADDSCVGRTFDFRIRAPRAWRKWFYHAPLFYWCHPDFPVNFSSKIAIVSMIISVIALFVSFLLA